MNDVENFYLNDPYISILWILLDPLFQVTLDPIDPLFLHMKSVCISGNWKVPQAETMQDLIRLFYDFDIQLHISNLNLVDLFFL